MVIDIKGDGTRVKYYTNVLGQKFYNEEDLMRNIKDAKKRGLGIYDPEFKASDIGHKRPRKGVVGSSSNCKKGKSTYKGRCNKKLKEQKGAKPDQEGLLDLDHS